MEPSVKLSAVTCPVELELQGVSMVELVAYYARVSNPGNQMNHETAPKLVKYLIDHNHWSPLEMVQIVMEIVTTRDIAHQIVRHRSFSFQEFCIAGDSKIRTIMPNGVVRSVTIEHMYKRQSKGLKLPSAVRVYDEDTNSFTKARIKEIFDTGVKPVFRITLSNGKTLKTTKEHKFLTANGFESLENAIGLRLIGKTAVIDKPDVALACNGIPVYQSYDWMYTAKIESLYANGLQYIATKANVTVHTIRKWLKLLGLTYTKKEVACYTSIWNKGVTGYSLPKHTIETIEKMRTSAKKGAESNLWRGGTSRSERLKIADWCNSIRSELLIKYNHKCNRCSSNLKLEIHHMKTVAAHPELAYDKDNLEVLCSKCHKDHHGTNGDRKIWTENRKGKGNYLTVEWSKVSKVEYIGEIQTYDMEVDHKSHNYVANGIVTHNSQRYAEVDETMFIKSECRMQDRKNRQASLECKDDDIMKEWEYIQNQTIEDAISRYKWAIDSGIAKEVARKILPEGLVATRLFMSGTLRSWLHYCEARTYAGAQLEHRVLALMAQKITNELMGVVL